MRPVLAEARGHDGDTLAPGRVVIRTTPLLTRGPLQYGWRGHRTSLNHHLLRQGPTVREGLPRVRPMLAEAPGGMTVPR